MATDKKWLSEERIIGLSGKKCKPQLALLFGISGQVQFTVGIRDAKVICLLYTSHEDFQRFDVDPEMTDHLVSYARMLDRAEVAMVFREVSPGLVRLGLRANAVDVASLARHFGGGGHRLASGATLQGDFQEIVAQVTSTAQRYLLTGELNERHS